MRKVFAVIAGLFLSGLALAQSPTLPGFPPGLFISRAPLDAAPAATYTGPGDIVSGAAVWYSCARAYNAAYATGSNNACDLRRASDNGTCTVLIASSGSADYTVGTPCSGSTVTAWASANGASCTGTIATTTLTLSACSSGTPAVNMTISGTGITQPAYITSIGTCASPPGTCTLNASQTVSSGETITLLDAIFVSKIYDQSGANSCSSAACPITQATAANQPQLLINCGNSVACTLHLHATQQYLYSTAQITGSAQPDMVSYVAQTNDTITQSVFSVNVSSTFNTGFSGTSTGRMTSGTAQTFTAATSTLDANAILFSGASSQPYVNGSASGGAVSAGTNYIGQQGGITVGTNAETGTQTFTGYIMEVGGWESNWSSPSTATNVTNVCHNQRIYYSSAGSC